MEKDSEIDESIEMMRDMRVDEASFAEVVDSAIRSRTPSISEPSRVLSFASVIDSMIRSRTPSNLGTSPVHRFASEGGKVTGNVTADFKLFPMYELVAATNNFSTENKIGDGSFGVVYRGKLIDGREVAIKRGETSSNRDGIGSEEFLNELKCFSKLHHKNLVRLLGLYQDSKERILVYEYIKYGSLSDNLHKLQTSALMSWPVRIKVALDVARGIQYLHQHEHAFPPIIYCDINSANILLDANCTAKVSGFWKLLMGSLPRTAGYVDPEYRRTGCLNLKSDVYSLGMVLLELLSGLKPIHNNENGMPRHVVDVMVPLIIRGKIQKVLDPRVPPPTPFEKKAVVYVGKLAADCVSLKGRDRPTMSQVVNTLEKAFTASLAHPIQSSTGGDLGAFPVHDFASVMNNGISSTGGDSGTFHSPVPMSNDVKDLQLFSLSVLEAATDNFSVKNKIGQGTIGAVYYGKLVDDREVGIQRVGTCSKMEEFQEFVLGYLLTLMPRLCYKNLVGLVGFCDEKNERLLVYEYMKNGTLYHHLHEKVSNVLNSWKMRVKIALDASRGIEYLHNHAVSSITHGGIQSSNILLDATWTARISDVGLTFMNNTAGTVGYIDPEYLCTSVLTTKSDVYGLGVVLLELLTGKTAIFECGEGGRNRISCCVVDFAVPAILVGELVKILDSRVGPPDVNEAEAVELVAYTALHCVNLKREDRLTMADIVVNLERALALCDSSHDLAICDNNYDLTICDNNHDSALVISYNSHNLVISDSSHDKALTVCDNSHDNIFSPTKRS